jgi:hypothetical protein
MFLFFAEFLRVHVLFVADNGSCEWRADEEELQRALECSLTINGSKWN